LVGGPSDAVKVFPAKRALRKANRDPVTEMPIAPVGASGYGWSGV